MSRDFSQAVIVTAGDRAHRAERQAAAMLHEEIRRRSGLDWPIRESELPQRPSILLAHRDRLPATLALPRAADSPAEEEEGYTIYLQERPRHAPRLWLVGGSGRASLYAVGRLLRWLETRHGSVTLPGQATGVLISTQPRFPLRGHQLGYRSIPNTYDAWTLARYKQYFRDLVMFGVNSVEFTPTLDPDEPPSVIMPTAPWTMNQNLSALCDDFDLDCWMWLPTDDGNPAHPDEAERMLARRVRFFQSLFRLDHLFIPGGDPGDVPPQALLPFLEKVAVVLRHAHPHAGLWISPQGWEAADRDFFYRTLQEQQPDWITGVVYGPWVRDTLPHLRQAIPARYRVRRYPDITHTCRCEFPVPEWDTAFARTLGREPINPRPVAEAHIHNFEMRFAEGCLTYSEGVNDDVNKAIWSERMWEPERPVRDILVEFGRAFFSTDTAEAVADGLLMLEENWRGSLLANKRPRHTLTHWRKLWNQAGKEGQQNWRLQQTYLRAVYDVYVQERLIGETQQEQEALMTLAEVERRPSRWRPIAKKARKILQTFYTTPEIKAMRAEIMELGERLWKSIGMQLSVPLYHAHDPERGAILDFLDAPLNNREWLLEGIHSAEHDWDEHDRELYLLTAWTDPGDGGFYDDLGNFLREPHLVRGDWAKDPGYLHSAQDEFGGDYPGCRLSWMRQASTLYDTPLEMRYNGLDKKARYRLRVLYHGRFKAKMRLEANGSHEIHGPLGETDGPSLQEFPLPTALTSGGELHLKWTRVEGRGCQVAEVWLLRELG